MYKTVYTTKEGESVVIAAENSYLEFTKQLEFKKEGSRFFRNMAMGGSFFILPMPSKEGEPESNLLLFYASFSDGSGFMHGYPYAFLAESGTNFLTIMNIEERQTYYFLKQ